MSNKDKLVKVINKYNGTVGYTVPDLDVHRNFFPGEIKEISINELEKLSYVPGGRTVLTEFLEIQDTEVVEEILNVKPEPEYYYTKDDIKKLMQVGTLDQFLDCLDFAPESVREIIKEMAVTLPLNDIAKRKAIEQKLGFDVTKAIEIKNTKYDGDENASDENFGRLNGRRSTPINDAKPKPTGRRYQPNKTE